MPQATVLVDGTYDFTGGVDSDAVTTVQSALVPHGLRRDQLGWLSNGTVRRGVISSRPGRTKLFDLLTGGNYQGGIVYETFDNVSDPILIVSVDGQIYTALLDPPYTITNITALFPGTANPASAEQAFFVEAEGFLVIQAGDYYTNPVPTLPLVYRSAFLGNPQILRRSRGLNGNSTVPPFLQEIPAATAMVYYMGRIWYAQGRLVSAGDIVGSTFSGSANYNYRNSVTEVTENPLAVTGDGFSVPTQAGNIRALAYTANLDTTLGQGPLYIFTRKQVYQLVVPVSRAQWIAAGNQATGAATGTSAITPAQINNGAAGSRCIVHINGDLFYQSIDLSIRSLFVSTRYFSQWGNVSISRNEQRALQLNNRSILRFAPAISFDNRLLMGVLPLQLPPSPPGQKTAQGVVCQGLVPLDMDTISTLDDREPPAWEGIWEGLNVFDMFTGDFGGLDRAFAVVASGDGSIDVWEIQSQVFTENGDNRITWYFETPAFTFGREMELKILRGGELWLDQVIGTVDITVYYRPDADACWHPWFITSLCAARNCAEDINTPICYPISPNFGPGQGWPITFPEPRQECVSTSKRPSTIGTQFQAKVVLTGQARVRGILLYAEPRERSLYEFLKC